MKKTQQVMTNDAISRRLFLRRSITLGAGVAAATALPAQAMVASTEEPAAESKSDGYHMTDHIAAYYKSAEV